MLDALYAAMAELGGDDDVRVIVIKGRGPSFCAGADFDWVADNYLDVSPEADRREILNIALSLFHAIWECPKPTILQVQGHCVAVGCYFLGFSDVVIADEDALFGSPESRSFGIEPSLGLWPFTIGPRWTKAMLYTGDLIDGRTAERIGMVNRAVPGAELEEYVEWLAHRIAKVDREILTLHKQAVNNVYEIMGMYPILKSGIYFDHMEHMSVNWTEFLTRMRKDGLKAALDWRDREWGGGERVEASRLSDPRP
jgi:enoyl-CoA hydratase